MSHKMLRPFIVKVSVLGYFPLYIYIYIYSYSFIDIYIHIGGIRGYSLYIKNS